MTGDGGPVFTELASERARVFRPVSGSDENLRVRKERNRSDVVGVIAHYGAGRTLMFESSLVIGDDARVRMVPLPGHTPGHAGVLVTGGDGAWLLAGDATFDVDQTERLAVAGATQDVSRARKTQALIKEAVRQGVALLPAHDPDVFERLGRLGSQGPKAAD